MKKISLVLSLVLILNIIFSSIVLGVTEATITAETAGTKMSSSFSCVIDNTQTITITARHKSGIKQIVYAFDDDEREYTITRTGENTSESVVVIIPKEYKDGYEHTLYIYAQTSEGTYNSEWKAFYFKVKSNKNTIIVPEIQIEANGKYLNEFTTVEMNKEDKIYFDISTENGIGEVIFAFDDDEKEYSRKNGEFYIDVPDQYKDGNQHWLVVQIIDTDGCKSVWYKYKFLVKEPKEDPVFTLYKNGTKVNIDAEIVLKESDELQAVASHPKGIEVIKYAFNNDKGEFYIYKEKDKILIPDQYKDGYTHKLVVLVESNDDTYTGWLTYSFRFDIEKQVDPDPDVPVKPNKEKPTISAKTASIEMNQNSTYLVELNQVINIKAHSTDGIKNITYMIDNGENYVILSEDIDIIAKKEYMDDKEHCISVTTISNNGLKSDTYKYYFKIKYQESKPVEPEKPTNKKYEVIMQPDETINNNVSKLAVSLRNISNLNGNKNRYALSEYAYYNIDFINAGSEINENITLTFNIPENISVNFIDTKGGQISGRTITWNFYGLKSGECGTIPVILSYTNISGDYQTVKPIATISTGGLKDVSAVQNIVYKANTTLNVNHKPYMYGDAKVDTFRPNDGINRAEMAAVITRVFELNKAQNYTVTYKDADTIAHDLYRWSTQDIMTVTKYGLMEGYEDGTFRPGDKVTKAEFITVLARLFETNNSTGFEIKKDPIKYMGNRTSHWASPYMAQLMRLNMIGNVLKVNENPDTIITRAEVAHLMNEVMFRGPADTNITENFSDVNPNVPYYTDILEATTDAHNAKFNTNGMETVIR